MKFEENYIYHIYNQGNNRRKIFFCRENYLFFLKKIETHICPYADILAWCLMPNHFHLMVFVRRLANSGSDLDAFAGGESHPELAFAGGESPPELAFAGGKSPPELVTVKDLNKNIGIMLASYTRAINKQENFTGSLFRKATKALCVNCPEGLSPSFYDTEYGTMFSNSPYFEQYPQVCFNYIHQNPVKAGLVKTITDWEFSSARDYAGLRDNTLVNKLVASEYLDICI